jgi:hypothetical protein
VVYCTNARSHRAVLLSNARRASFLGLFVQRKKLAAANTSLATATADTTFAHPV